MDSVADFAYAALFGKNGIADQIENRKNFAATLIQSVIRRYLASCLEKIPQKHMEDKTISFNRYVRIDKAEKKQPSIFQVYKTAPKSLPAKLFPDLAESLNSSPFQFLGTNNKGMCLIAMKARLLEPERINIFEFSEQNLQALINQTEKDEPHSCDNIDLFLPRLRKSQCSKLHILFETFIKDLSDIHFENIIPIEQELEEPPFLAITRSKGKIKTVIVVDKDHFTETYTAIRKDRSGNICLTTIKNYQMKKYIERDIDGEPKKIDFFRYIEENAVILELIEELKIIMTY
jgi:hypothetical protein